MERKSFSLTHFLDVFIVQYQCDTGQRAGYIKMPLWRKDEFHFDVGDGILMVMHKNYPYIHEQYRGIPIIWSDKIHFIELGQLIGNKA